LWGRQSANANSAAALSPQCDEHHTCSMLRAKTANFEANKYMLPLL
jgi:hypothetical protein